MKRIFTILFFLVTCFFALAQDVNQFDANGKRHGIWKKSFKGTNIVRYEGRFLHGKEVGLFKFYKKYRNKAVLSATKLFNENNAIASVKFLASNGKVISQGKMNGKIYVGTWKYYQKQSDKLLTLETYNDKGELSGERFVYYPNGQIAEKQNYINGLLEGESVWYSVKGIKLKEYLYKNGELHGLAKFYNPKGEIVSEGKYKRGKKDGVWKYYENSKQVREKDFTYKPKYIKKTP
jgi:antitoxin component YwqK of YwqJK toxin-antitoxin module